MKQSLLKKFKKNNTVINRVYFIGIITYKLFVESKERIVKLYLKDSK